MEDLVGRLPESAFRHRAWWGNNDSTAAPKAWLNAGWRVESVNQAAGEVVFTRTAAGQATITGRESGADPSQGHGTTGTGRGTIGG